MAKRRSTSKKSDRRLLVITSDWHASHKLGLMNPETVLYEQRIDGKGKAVKKELDYTLGEFQRYLWNTVWMKSIEDIKHLADGYPVGVVVNGDITQGLKHPEQLVTTSIANQFLIAEGALKPMLDKIPNLNLNSPANSPGRMSWKRPASTKSRSHIALRKWLRMGRWPGAKV